MTSPSHYNAPPSDFPAARQERRHQSAAASFHSDPAMERAHELRTTDPAAYDRLPAATKIGLGYYLLARAAFESKP